MIEIHNYKRFLWTLFAWMTFGHPDSLASSLSMSDWRVTASAEHFEGYDRVTRKAFSDRFQDFEGGSRTLRFYGDSTVRIGMDKGDWGLDLFWTQQVFIKASPDTGRLYQIIQGSAGAVSGERFDVHLNGIAARRQGLAIRREFKPLLNLQEGSALDRLEASLSVYNVADFRRSGVRGNAEVIGQDDYRFALQGNDQYSRKNFEFPAKPGDYSGQGVSLGLSSRWTWSGERVLTASVQDLFNYNKVQRLPSVSSDLTSDVNSRDANGNLQVRAALIQQNSYQNDQFSLKRRGLIRYEAPLSLGKDSRFMVGAQTYGNFVMPIAGVYCTRCVSDRFVAGIESNLYYKSVGPVLKNDRFTFYLQTDALSSSERKVISAGARYMHPF